MEKRLCNMTIGIYDIVAGHKSASFAKCCRPAKFINPRPQMGILYVCGIHARSLDKMFVRTGQGVRCLKIR